MPLYEYRCRDCQERFEVLQRMGEGPEAVVCPECGGHAAERQLSTFAAGVSSTGSAFAGAGAGAGAGCGSGACGSGFT